MQKSINLALLLLLPFFAFAQEKFTLSGYVKDASSGSELLGATVYVTQLKNGATTNMYGFYSLTLPKGKYNIEYSYLGYQKKNIEIDLTEDTKRDVELQSNSQQLQEVVVEAERQDQNVKDVQMSVEKLTMDKIQKIPQLLGEADVIKSIQLRPGVSTVGEGATGFNVRGGNIDQNLILLDEAPIFNSSHLFGFFSTFNPDAIKDATLYKGGIPARYGGRLSSVLDVRQREGNMREFKVKGGIGALFSRLTLEGPIAKDKVSFLVSGRRSYADLFLKLDDELADNTAYFYDLNAKVNWKVNENNRIFLSGYFGRDIFSFGDFFRAGWGNSSFTARWNHLFSEKLFSNFTAFYSNYSYSLGADQGGQSFDWQSNIQNTNFKADFTYYLNPKNTVKFGVNGMYYIFEPGQAEASGESFTSEIVVPTEYALEPAIYASNEQKVGEIVTLKYGLRYSHFFNLGKRDVNVYRYGRPTNDADIIGSESYDQNEVIADYGGFEPRFGANILVSPVSSVKASYMRTRQYLHLVSNTTAATPLDVWKPAGEYVKPAKADQVVVGYFRNFKSNMYEMSTEVYGKWMYDLLDYKNGAELILNETVENEFLSGRGRSFGLEFMVEKKKGDFTGWVSYTLSRTQQKVEGYQVGDYTEAKNGINNGDWYSSNWDKTHDVTVVANYDISKKWSVAANFTFQTGRPITYPMGKYYYDGKLIPNFKNRNNERLPAYHRLDLSATLNPESISDKFSYSLTFGVYNTYGRKNPYSIYFQQSENNPLQSEAVRLAIIGIPVPAVTFNFEF
jgi:hypothetical protein